MAWASSTTPKTPNSNARSGSNSFRRPQFAGGEEKHRFLREAQAAAALNHATIAKIVAIDETDSQTFIAMEFIEGKSLHRIIVDKGGVNNAGHS